MERIKNYTLLFLLFFKLSLINMNPNSNKVLTFNDIYNDGRDIYVTDCLSKTNYDGYYGTPIVKFYEEIGITCPTFTNSTQFATDLTKCIKYADTTLKNSIEIGIYGEGDVSLDEYCKIVYGDFGYILDRNDAGNINISKYTLNDASHCATNKLIRSNVLPSLTENIEIFEYDNWNGGNIFLDVITNISNVSLDINLTMRPETLIADIYEYYFNGVSNISSNGTSGTNLMSGGNLQTVIFKKNSNGEIAKCDIYYYFVVNGHTGYTLNSGSFNINLNGKTYGADVMDNIVDDGEGSAFFEVTINDVEIADIPYINHAYLTLKFNGGGIVEPDPEPDPIVTSYIDLSNWHIKTSNTSGSVIPVSLNGGLEFLRSGCWFYPSGETGVTYMFDSNGYSVDPEEYSFMIDVNILTQGGILIHVDTSNNPPVGNYLIGILFDDTDNNSTGSPRIQSEIYFYLNFDEFGNVTDLADGESWINLVNSHYDAVEYEANGEYDVTLYAYNRAARIKHFDNSLPLTGNIQQIAKGTTYNYTNDYSGNAPAYILLNKNAIATSGGSGILAGACKKPVSGFTSWKTLTPITSLTTAFKNVYILPNAYCNTFENIIRFIKYGPTFRT